MTPWKNIATAVAVAAVIVTPQLLATTQRPDTPPAQPTVESQWWSGTDPNGRHDWPLLGQCWIDRFLPHTQRQAAFATLPDHCRDPQLSLRMWCDWRADYPSRYWVEQACGRIADWPANFGASWWGQAEQHPARDWVARLRAGGQP